MRTKIGLTLLISSIAFHAYPQIYVSPSGVSDSANALFVNGDSIIFAEELNVASLGIMGSSGNSILTLQQGITNNGIINFASTNTIFSQTSVVDSMSIINQGSITYNTNVTVGNGGADLLKVSLTGPITLESAKSIDLQSAALNVSTGQATDTSLVIKSGSTLQIPEGGTSYLSGTAVLESIDQQYTLVFNDEELGHRIFQIDPNATGRSSYAGHSVSYVGSDPLQAVSDTTALFRYYGFNVGYEYFKIKRTDTNPSAYNTFTVALSKYKSRDVSETAVAGLEDFVLVFNQTGEENGALVGTFSQILPDEVEIITYAGQELAKVTLTDFQEGFIVAGQLISSIVGGSVGLGENYNYVTLNDDGFNDVLVVNGVGINGNTVSIQIIDAYNDVVYTNDNYNNTWVGECNSGPSCSNGIVKPGLYFILIKLSGNNGGKTTKTWLYVSTNN